ncbi:MAG: 1-(5-phosphoribosyl)-5-[(5-phosphoribosylamino)methylideneamino]imidazole-4-carboxamide isomerase [Alphaproteobacteria bacterium]|nr:1-(5-phosphoribosyl)-5-[(5-phosphoribosylamino)methylideneamino]imidazole-4-carboxamide isomerase [Alphaproteobacteria bacterium]
MKLYPAIDLKNGACVRLEQGDFDSAKIYEANPVLQAQKFADAGTKWVHVVDLDGARRGEMIQLELIERIAKETQMKVQAGGGIRNAETIKKLLDAGIERVIVGSLAVKKRKLVESWLKEFGPERIVLAFDIKFVDGQPLVLISGWQNESKQILWDVLEAYEASGLTHILCTDVHRDGMLLGPNATLYQSIREKAPNLQVIASGGVSCLEDLKKLAKIPVAGVVFGKAIYEGRIDIATALKEIGHAG